MLMTAADVSAIAKPWELQHETAKMVADEFFDQGDMEKLQLNITPMVWKLLQFPLTPMGVLATGSAQVPHEALQLHIHLQRQYEALLRAESSERKTNDV